MPKRDIIVIGTSAGGVYALRELVASLPSDLGAAVFVVQHLAPHTKSLLPDILNKAGSLPAVHPQDGERIEPGRIYLAPPDHHLLIEHNHVVVKKGPKENRFRPSIDALFRSAAYTYGPRVIGVVLTGLLDDGTSGMWSVKRLGGVGIIQQPEDAAYPSMPTNVLENVDVDHSVPIAEMGKLLSQLTTEPAPDAPQLPQEDWHRLESEVKIASQENAFDLGVMQLGELTPFTCPECNGVLVSLKEGKLIRYRCHTGHAFTASTLLAEVTKEVEDTLWSAVRGLEETIMLLDQTSHHLAELGDAEMARQFADRADHVRDRSRRLHEFTFQQEQLSEEKSGEIN